MLILGLPQPAAPAATLPSELAAKIATDVAPATEITLAIAADENEKGSAALRDELVRTLRARGIRALDRGDGLASVTASCGSNLRERVCLAEIVKPGGDRRVAAATRPHDVDSAADRGAPLSLELRPVFGQRAPILDVALAGDRLLVLDPGALTLYQRGTAGWQRLESRAVTSSRPWPRDMRGRLRLEGTTVDALLPGASCRANVDLSGLSCADDRQPWPLGIDNTGVDASRNFFSTPEGLPFYAAAPLASDAAGARWVLVDRFGALIFLDATRQMLASAGTADDIVALGATCGVGAHVLVASSRAGSDRGDVLRLFRVSERQLIAAAAPLEVPGIVTALWAAPGATIATAVAHDIDADRYEAFQIAIACDR
jgi:hypothetical protein